VAASVSFALSGPDGMMREYIFRHNHPDRFEYFHEVSKEQLGETYGVMVYQEDVIKIVALCGLRGIIR
jgi:DNA polymerase-3 subunit alpha/error-prone DNA polymerase